MALGALLSGCAASNLPPLALERTIVLHDVVGRIDHLAIDDVTRRLAVAEVANGSVDLIDVESGALIHRFAALKEPQGLAFDQAGEILVVAEGGSGAVQLFDARRFNSIATIFLGADADNVRIDPRNGNAIVGYGAGALAVINLASHAVIERIALPCHPEGFQIDAQTGRAYVNLPDRRTIGVVDLDHGALLATWPLPLVFWNFPLALDTKADRLASVFRFPARFLLFDRTTGAVSAAVPVCGDGDDVFFDGSRSRAYVSCGAGTVDAFDVSGPAPRRLGSTPTSAGARTAFFDASGDTLFVAAPGRWTRLT